MSIRPVLVSIAVVALFSFGSISTVRGQEESEVAEVSIDSEKLTVALNGGRADEVASMFLPQGELVDESGAIYRGQQEIKELVSAFVAKFPDTTTRNEMDSIRIVGPAAIQEGKRITTAKDGSVAAIRYICFLVKTNEGWRIASLREFADQELKTSPGEYLKPLAWLIGEWINEGADARVKISYRWSEDTNFILGDILVTNRDQVVMKSSQRIGWDALHGIPRSWTFDSDGGFAEATWTQVDDAWIVRSAATMPDGQTGSATLTITKAENDRHVMVGTNRIIGNALENDYEVTVVKQPPTAEK